MGLYWLFVLAFAFYTLSIFSAPPRRRLRPWMIVTFGAGVAADALGTLCACAQAAEPWSLTVHSVLGWLALGIMLLHFFFALLAWFADARFPRWFHRYSLTAWLLWLVSFLTGPLIR